MEVQCPPEAPEKPIITGEIDLPFPDLSVSAQDEDLANEVELKAREQKHKHKVEDYKNVVGGILLAVCFLVIITFSLMDALIHIESTLFTGAFEFAKTIATAVIGYLFASNAKEK